jgi:exopolysaccharide biosynthesis polyprenyl glycosylphosphotransferase
MRNATAYKLWTEPTDPPSQYARMIPGTSALAVHRARAAVAEPSGGRPGESEACDETPNRPAQARTTLAHLLLPQPIADPFTLYQWVVSDLIVLVMACGLPLLISPAWGFPQTYIPVYAVLVTLFGFTEGLYKGEERRLARIVPILARSAVFAAALVFVAVPGELQPLAAPTTLTTSLAGLLLWRYLRQTAWTRRTRDAEPRNVLIVGGGPVACAIARALRNNPVQHALVRGFLADDVPLSPAVLGRIEDLGWLARAQFIDEVILALPDEPVPTRRAAAIALRNRLDIRAVPDLPPDFWPDAGVDRIGGVPVVTLHREPLPSAALFFKRVMDVAGAALGLVLASPLMAVVALLIRLDSTGPAVYSAERTGAKGRRFRCFKFRSMVTDADRLKDELRGRNQRQGPIFKIDDDPRITRVGRIIRRYSLDELPQLWNVLRGEMSLVGPRPHPVDEVNHYELHHYRRLDVRPGITGLWQITARNCPSFDLNMHLDLTYIENWSLRLDLRILASTVRVLFAPEGA